jgi:hypothetical protein
MDIVEAGIVLHRRSAYPTVAAKDASSSSMAAGLVKIPDSIRCSMS